MRYLSGFLLFCLFLHPVGASASDPFINWHSSNIQLLRGGDYELGDQNRTIATFEHANSWRYGDFFMFIDYSWSDGGAEDYYAEFSPRFSLSKITGRSVKTGIIKDVLIAATLETPKNQKTTLLYGLGTDLDVPGFSFFTVNAYVRDNPNLAGEAGQLTLAWLRPFSIDQTSWVFEGFADFAGAEGTTRANQLIVPRLLLDVGALARAAKGKLWMGVEYSHSHNKFGVDGVTESVAQIQVKWVF